MFFCLNGKQLSQNCLRLSDYYFFYFRLYHIAAGLFISKKSFCKTDDNAKGDAAFVFGPASTIIHVSVIIFHASVFCTAFCETYLNRCLSLKRKTNYYSEKT